ncbi:hypothetical protein [Hymenobacter lapidiphilus]|uniref:Beta-hexosaminidase bacterial type N-terminal domain-containing protein n=1 Tax=Hymenobacter lapidiphilus TaxID=2608003 RepID=A0A7Y7PNN1_9BACT|nr:hypothetical protein [Hymenobacter lapidiphilus]NVO31085.1 hypothetical protein [Hymenobacter lapidiphilus]
MLRYVLLLSGLLFLTAVPTFAQTGGLRTKPIDFDNTIVLTLPDEGPAAWKRAGRLIAQRGYPIRFASPELLTLSTEVMGARKATPLGFTVAVNGHELHLRGFTSYTDIASYQTSSSAQLLLIEYMDSGNARGRQWQELEDVARLLGGTRQYTRVGID